ncbi:hypothetical protein ColLi_11313 [Colletotrichum liriopes]|uniref:Uncharacterized protein n=1 Tax=Colletotrichum liriopes TaxID=708192 RepID=A0AA37GW92_9PEZI|nr:hypothetical protein ColLi_11313 [Colletotrichum liriopes]
MLEATDTAAPQAEDLLDEEWYRALVRGNRRSRGAVRRHWAHREEDEDRRDRDVIDLVLRSTAAPDGAAWLR